MSLFIVMESSSSDVPENEYEVEKVLNHKQIGNRMKYYVKWKGYDSSENTWEPESNLQNAQEKILEYWNSKSDGNNTKQKRTATASEKPKPEAKNKETKGNTKTNKNQLELSSAAEAKNKKVRIVSVINDNGLYWACLIDNKKRLISNEEMKKNYLEHLLKYYETHITFEEKIDIS